MAMVSADQPSRPGVHAGHREKAMSPTAQLRNEIQRLNRIIAEIEAKPRQEGRFWAPTLRDLQSERQMLARIVTARRSMARAKVVELQRWRDPVG
jgi:hypothetical protein